MKKYNISYNVGKVKYVINFHNGESKHNDGSEFFDIKTFKNKNAMLDFIKQLVSTGYKYTM